MGLTQNHKTTVQGRVPRVSIRVELFGFREESLFNFFSADTRMYLQQFIIVMLLGCMGTLDRGTGTAGGSRGSMAAGKQLGKGGQEELCIGNQRAPEG